MPKGRQTQYALCGIVRWSREVRSEHLLTSRTGLVLFVVSKAERDSKKSITRYLPVSPNISMEVIIIQLKP